MRNAGETEPIASETVFARVPNVLVRRTSTSVVVLADPPAVVLRGTGVAVWDVFETPQSFGDATAVLSRRYAAPIDVVRRDVHGVLVDLQRANALRIESEARA